VTVKLESGDYRPNHYVEVTCAHSYSPQPSRSHNYEYGYRGNELLRALLSERGEKREVGYLIDSNKKSFKRVM